MSALLFRVFGAGAICALLLLAACGGGSSGPGATDTKSDAKDAAVETGGDAGDLVGIDAENPPPPDDGDRDDQDEPEAVGDLPLDQENPDECPCVGCWMCPCTTNEECQTFCVTTKDGGRCTKTCSDDCPEGWACRDVKNTQGDVMYVCVPAAVHLCRPCEQNGECAGSLGVFPDKCVSYGASGKFCGSACGAPKDPPCPSGYSCQEVTVVGGSTAKQCVPDSGVCECGALAIEAGASTKCFVNNNAGTGFGVRECRPSGLSDCDARTPKKEACNKVDDNCDGITDGEGADGCTVWFQDNDLDDYGIGVGKCVCEKPGPGFSQQAGDCNDSNNGMNPGVQEVCNGMDDDCNGITDDAGAAGCKVHYLDEDGDGWGVFSDSKCLCAGVAPYTGSGNEEDCDDANKDIYPGAKEKCDGKDNDCDGGGDAEGAVGCEPYYYDEDGDGYGLGSKFKCLCGPVGNYKTKKAGDCNDLDPAVNTATAERCNGKDDNCNGLTDEDDPVVMCPPRSGVDLHGVVVCDGVCKVNECQGPTTGSQGEYVPAWHDLNQDFSDGCECQADVGEKDGAGQMCGTSPIDLGVFPDAGFKTLIQGNVVPADDEDWYVLDATDVTWNAESDGCDHFNVKVFFTQNPSSTFVLDMYRESCAEANNICKGTYVGEWNTWLLKDGKGECPCVSDSLPACDAPANVAECYEMQQTMDRCGTCPGVGAPGANLCSDDTARFYIRIYRDKTKPATCLPYEIEVSNGAYPYM
ncbi:MAG: putative metal-binding motif-containing protein [Deltaproteobacteria bacterium]|nr:putative metal-binding motif-containing protein [Deltaproteobacteria bacterium]